MAKELHASTGTAVLLPVAQFKESHELGLDLTRISAGGATVVAPPYQAMAVGDVATLTLKLFFDDGIPWDPFKRAKTLVEADIGQPVQWVVPKDELEIIEGGYLEAGYSIVYASPTVPTLSEQQTVHIVAPTAPLLPRLAIKDFSGDTLDPEAYPGGVTLTIEPYSGMAVGDDVLLYATGDTRLVKAVRVDQTTVDSRKLDITLGYDWLSANNGHQVSLMYQYARPGSAGSSMPFELMLRKPLYLPHPLIKGVIREGEDDEFKGYLPGRSTTGGVEIDIPQDAVIGAGDKVQMVWDGFKPGGYVVADATVGNPRKFKILAEYVPANLGKRLFVYYQVTPPGETADNSWRFDLRIEDLASGWPTVQITVPPGSSSTVSLRAVTDAVTFRVGSWMFMAAKQLIRISVTGLNTSGTKETINLREGSEEVTEDEYYDGKVEARLQRTFLSKLKLNEKFDVLVEASFDGGASYKKFPMISPQLVE